MNNQISPLKKMLVYAAIAANYLLIAWILYNGLRENFSGTNVEKASYIALMLLLLTNALLLLKNQKS